MSKIHILASDISNKIAAGEVVENPASAVKELIENAVDAGASVINIEIKNGGISYIRVTDNGAGMEKDDAKTAFLRHATSKIANVNDLESISTLGFRGEALASISAVSNIELLTKTEHTEGVHLELRGGKLVSEQAAGCPNGTTIVVKDLFYNTPARMKFLKSDKTEAAHITDIIERLMLANPNISFKYIADGKEKLFFGGGGQFESCIYSIYGREYAKASCAVDRNQNNIKVTGIVGKPELSRGNRSFQSFFLNGRYIKNRSLTYAAESAYSNTLMTGRFPFFAIHLNIPFELVDINVHPTKQEVKFANERAVCDEVYWAVKNALVTAADEVRREFAKPDIQSFSSKHSFSSPVLSEPHRQLQMPLPKKSLEMLNPGFSIAETEELEQVEELSYKIIGQLFGTYIVAELENMIVLIDQHASHERMIFERLKKAEKEKTVISQSLLTPVSLTLSPKEYSVMMENIKAFFDLGFEIEEFGNNSILVRQTPVDIGEEELKLLIIELIDKMQKTGREEYTLNDDILEMISCKAAVKGNSSLHESEIKSLIDDVIKTGGVNTCPHGRPLMVTITKYELEKMFKRVV